MFKLIKIRIERILFYNCLDKLWVIFGVEEEVFLFLKYAFEWKKVNI